MERMIKDKDKTIKKYMNFLGFLYITLENEESFNMNEACILHKVNKRVPSVLKNRGVLIKEGTSLWKWNSKYSPNPEMIKSVLKEISEVNAIQKKEKHNESVKMEDKKEDVKGGLELFLNYAYINCRMDGKFNMRETLSKFNVSSSIYPVIVPSLMECEGKGRASRWSWVSESIPSKELTIEIEKKAKELKDNRKKNGGKRKGAGRKPLKVEVGARAKAIEMRDLGMTNVDIGMELGVAEGTVRNWLSNPHTTPRQDVKTSRVVSSKVSLFWGLFSYESKK